MFDFKILHQSKIARARLGEITTPHGKILTPAFVPVATQASLKSLTPKEIKEIGVQVCFVNTYHLWLRPSEKVVEKMGGVHKFMGWNGPLMSDSGGFQVFSLGFGKEQGVGKIGKRGSPVKSSRENALVSQKPRLVNIDEKGVTFTSHLDGSTIRLTPQKSIAIQEKLGADIILAFDECTSPLNSYEYTREAMKRTHAWAKICLKAKTRQDQALFGVVQGGPFEDLRKKSAQFIGKLPFEGMAIGGSFGQGETYQALNWITPLLSTNKPRHLLGIGGIKDIFEGVKRGVDSFDCVIPTRLARNGTALVNSENQSVAAPSLNQNKFDSGQAYGAQAQTKFRMSLSNSEFREDPQPIEENCSCYTCQNFSRAYLNHLFRAHEMLGPHLLTIHNLTFMENLMTKIREAVQNDNLLELEKRYAIRQN